MSLSFSLSIFSMFFRFQMHYSSSDNYLWSSIDSLGKGATGGVYKGRHMRTGNSVAIKLFNNESNSFWRELEILKNTPMHDNIVKFVSMETEHSSKRRVIIMELCTGGSLYNIIDHPENGFGLNEDELICVMKDVVSGLNHLHQNKIIHRDIKPGNIMRCINENGSHIYKLVDFGAARQLDPSDTFTSLYGTEEYLHPDMYERAVLRKNKGKAFNRNVDLWSIGATFYHVITGKLPFRPFLGRLDQHTMYRMTGEKASGVISAFQLEQNGKIFWETKLPEFISSFDHLRLLLSSILAGILESNPENCMSFQEFVDQINLITSFSTIIIFCFYNSTYLKIYIDPKQQISDWFSQLKEKVSTFTDIDPACQLYYFNDERFSFVLGDQIPTTTMDLPLFLMNTHNISVSAHFVIPPNFNYSDQSIALDKDYYNTKIALSYVHYYQRICKNIIIITKLLNRVASSLFNTIYNELSAIKNVFMKTKQVLKKHTMFENICKYIFDSFAILSIESCNEFYITSNFIQSIQKELFERAQNIIELIAEIESNFTSLENMKLFAFFGISPLHSYLVYEKQFDIQLKMLNDAQNCFIRDYKHNNLVHPLEKANHNFYIKQAYQTISQSKEIFEKVMNSHTKYHASFIDWVHAEVNSNFKVIDQLNAIARDIEEKSTHFNDDIELQLTAILRQSIDTLSNSPNKNLNEKVVFNKELVKSIWTGFIHDAGPSILSLDLLATSLSEMS